MSWLVSVLFGLLFGSAMMRFWVVGRVAHAVREERKELPPWLFYLAGNPPDATYARMKPEGDRVGLWQKMFAVITMLGIFVLSEFVIFAWRPASVRQFLVYQAFPLMCLLGFLAPVLLISRYIRGLPEKPGEQS